MSSNKSDDETTIDNPYQKLDDVDNEDQKLDDVDNDVVTKQKENELTQEQKINGMYDIIKNMKLNDHDEINSLRTTLKIRTGVMILFIVLFFVLILVLTILGVLIGVSIAKIKENISDSAKDTVKEIGSFIFDTLSDSLYGNDNLYGHSRVNKTFVVNGSSDAAIHQAMTGKK